MVNKFDKLPDEMLPFIFKHLDVKDLCNCRCVSKRFRFWADKVKFTELAINDLNLEKPRKWYYTNDQANSIELPTN